MPITYRIEKEDATLLLWEITEDEQALSALVSESDLSSAVTIASSRRRMERLAWRAALRTVVPDREVFYDVNGSPFFRENDLYISSAHTHGMAAVVVGHRRCGVDIECAGRDFSKVAGRVMDKGELEIVRGLEPPEDMRYHPMGIVWCVKEAAYKYYGKRGLDLKADIVITGCEPVEDKVFVQICGRGQIGVDIIPVPGFIVAAIV